MNIDESKTKDILNFFADREIFDSDLYKNQSVISSKDIQLCFQAAIRSRAKKNPRIVQNYWILAADETESYILFSDKGENNNIFSEKNPVMSDSYSEIYDTNKRKENKSKEKEIKEKQIKENKTSDGLVLVVDFYKKYFGDIKQEETDRLAELLEKYEDKLIMECILIAAQKGIKKLSYIIGILKNLDKSGITTLEQYERSKRNDTFTGANEKHNEQHTEEYGTTV